MVALRLAGARTSGGRRQPRSSAALDDQHIAAEAGDEGISGLNVGEVPEALQHAGLIEAVRSIPSSFTPPHCCGRGNEALVLPPTSAPQRRRRPRAIPTRPPARSPRSLSTRPRLPTLVAKRAENLRGVIGDVLAEGITGARQIAAELNKRAILTARGV